MEQKDKEKIEAPYGLSDEFVGDPTLVYKDNSINKSKE